MITVGNFVQVRGERYRVVAIRGCSHLGSKFWGKFVFTLEAADGTRVEAFGKTVAANSKLRPARETA